MQVIQKKVKFLSAKYLSGVTVIWVPPSFVYPHTHITRDMSIPRGDTNSTEGKIISGRKILKIFSIYIFDTAANLCNVTSNKLTVYNYVKVKHKDEHPCDLLSIIDIRTQHGTKIRMLQYLQITCKIS